MAAKPKKSARVLDTRGRDGKMDGRLSLDRLQDHWKWEIPVELVGVK